MARTELSLLEQVAAAEAMYNAGRTSSGEYGGPVLSTEIVHGASSASRIENPSCPAGKTDCAVFEDGAGRSGWNSAGILELGLYEILLRNADNIVCLDDVVLKNSDGADAGPAEKQAALDALAAMGAVRSCLKIPLGGRMGVKIVLDAEMRDEFRWNQGRLMQRFS